MNQNSRLLNILVKGNINFDLLRLIAAIMVIYSHSFVLAISNNHQDIFSKLSNELTNSGSNTNLYFN